MRLNNILLNSSIFLALFFSMHTLHIWTGLIVESSFNSILSTFWIVVAFSIFLIGFLVKFPVNWCLISPSIIKPEPAIFLPAKKFLIPSLILMCIAMIIIALGKDEFFYLSWFFLALGITLLFIGASAKKTAGDTNDIKFSQDNNSSLLESILLMGIGLILVILYLFSSMNNPDDTHFVSTIVGLIQHPDAILFSIDKIFNQGGNNEVFMWNYGQSWEALAAIISMVASLNYLTVYYLYLPIVFLFFTPVPLFYFTKIYFPKNALISVFFAFTILICWSSYNHLHGMFFLPRMYQGKAILLSFFLPLLFLVARRFFIDPDIKTGIVTCLLLISSGGSANSGLYASILVLGLCYFSFTPINWHSFIYRGIFLLLIIMPNLMMISNAKSQIEMSRKTQFTITKGYTQTETQKQDVLGESTKVTSIPLKSMYWLFGDHRYLFFFILLFLATFLLLYWGNNYQFIELKRFYLVLGLLAFNHPLAIFLADLTGMGSIVWRFHWIIPMGLICCFFSARVLDISSSLTQKKTIPKVLNKVPPWFLQAILLSPVYLFPLLLVVKNLDYFSRIYDSKIVIHKTNIAAMVIAKDIVKYEKPSDIVLSENHVAEILPMLLRKSQLITSRALYWWLPYFRFDDLHNRKRLQHLINEIDSWTERDLIFLNSEIKKRKISVLVLKQTIKSEDIRYNQKYSDVFSNFDCLNYSNFWMVCKIKNDFSGL